MRQPIRPALRTAHLVLGLVTGAAFVLIAVSGALLVVRSEIDAALHPGLVRVEPRGAPAPLQTLVDAAQRRHPTLALTSLDPHERADRAWRVLMTDARGDRFQVAIDPYSAEVLGTRHPERSPLHALRTLHAEAYLGTPGRVVLGGLGVALVAQGASGLYLLWPFARRRSTRRPRGRRPWPALCYDLHRTVGAASVAFHLLVAGTGAVLGLGILASPGDGPAPSPPITRARHPLSVDAIARRAEQALPGGRITSIRFAASPDASVTVKMRLPGELAPFGRSAVLLDPHGGQVLGVRDARATMASRGWDLMLALHVGALAGATSKTVYVIGALASLALVATGCLSWLGSASPRPRARHGGGRWRARPRSGIHSGQS